jgi:hypothetical protein
VRTRRGALEVRRASFQASLVTMRTRRGAVITPRGALITSRDALAVPEVAVPISEDALRVRRDAVRIFLDAPRLGRGASRASRASPPAARNALLTVDHATAEPRAWLPTVDHAAARPRACRPILRAPRPPRSGPVGTSRGASRAPRGAVRLHQALATAWTGVDGRSPARRGAFRRRTSARSRFATTSRASRKRATFTSPSPNAKFTRGKSEANTRFSVESLLYEDGSRLA